MLEWYGRNLTTFAATTGELYIYGYNADGIRTSKELYNANGNSIGSVKYTLDGNKIVAENRLGTNIYYTYDDKGAIMDMIYGGESYLFSKNLQGDVIGIYNDNGTLVAKYEYNAFGEITAITNASGTDVSANATHIANVNPFRYRGYYYDTEIGFYYLQTRYYDPEIGRWINADAQMSGVGGDIRGHNLFAYCFNNPVNMIDPTGNWPSWGQVFAAVATVAVATVFAVAVVASAGAVGVAAGVAAASIGATGTMVSAAITVGTVGTYVVAAGIEACALSDAGEILTGTNVIRDELMGGTADK